MRYHKGGILIEFAFSIPILISLLFFINDHYRFHELKDKVKSSAYLAASMIQQINNNKSDKQLTKSDMGRIAFASAMNFFHGQSIFDPWPFGVYYVLDCFWVKRIDSDTYQYQESWGSTYGTTTDPNKIGSYYSVSTIDANKVKSIHPNLICNTNGEERLLVECVYKKRKYSKSKLGFFILEPPWMKSTDGSTISIFVYHTVITPKPGLFPVK